MEQVPRAMYCHTYPGNDSCVCGGGGGEWGETPSVTVRQLHVNCLFTYGSFYTCLLTHITLTYPSCCVTGVDSRLNSATGTPLAASIGA